MRAQGSGFRIESAGFGVHLVDQSAERKEAVLLALPLPLALIL